MEGSERREGRYLKCMPQLDVPLGLLLSVASLDLAFVKEGLCAELHERRALREGVGWVCRCRSRQGPPSPEPHLSADFFSAPAPVTAMRMLGLPTRVKNTSGR